MYFYFIFFGLKLSKKYGDFLGYVGINVEFLGSSAKTMSFWPFLVQNDVVLDAITFFFFKQPSSSKRRRFGL